MPTDPSALMNLSIALQVSIASGYLAYLIAYGGVRQHHTAADTVLKSFAFGLFATAIMKWGYQHPVWTPVVALAVALVIGICWRWFGLQAWGTLIRNSGVNWSDDIPSAWLSITATKTNSSPSQVAVTLMDGRILLCEDTRNFKDAHEGPVVFGLTGDIGLYVTAECREDGTWDEKKDVVHDEGILLTYLPASQIKRVELRYLNTKASTRRSRRRWGNRLWQRWRS